ncbi:MAG TPA: glycosyltransferase family 2 protein [Acidobacteriota bacterium]|nr:glycosyltransferase family 2 protein [Acidobacteriota bacterium]
MSTYVTAVVINYNGKQVIQACLQSVLQQRRPFNEVFVVDNASTDGSQDLIRDSFPQVHLIESARNEGFAAACNRGIKDSKGDLVAILNNDITLDPDWLDHLLKYNHPPWSFFASRILLEADPERLDSAGDGMAVIGSAYKIGHGAPARLFHQRREVFGPSGAAALYHRHLLEATGGFDEDFFLIYEDADLNMRARLLGFRCLYVPEAVVRHKVNLNIGTFSHQYVFYGHRNSEYVFWKNMPGLLLLLYLPERILFNLLCLIYFSRLGRGKSFLQAKVDFLRNSRKVFSKRRKIQAERQVAWHDFRRALDRNWFRYRWKKRTAP